MAINMDTKGILNEYFPYSTPAVGSESVFKCAFFCSTKGDVFTFFKHVCKCINENDIKSQIVEIPECIYWDPSQMIKVEDVYSISRRSLPIFKFEKDLQNSFIQKGDGKPNKHHCLSKSNGIFKTNDCTSTKIFTCEGDNTILYNGYMYETWTNATYTCLEKNRSLLKSQSTDLDHWLRYFMYKEDKGNEQCVSIRKNSTSMALNYQFRLCSDLLPVLCKDENDSTGHVSTPVSRNRSLQFYVYSTESNFDRTKEPALTNSTDVEAPDDLCIKITTGGAVTFATIIIFLLGIIYIQRRKLIKASFTSLTVRRDQNNYNEIPQGMSDSITGQHYEVSPLSEISASGSTPTVQQSIDLIQHIDTSGYLIPSGMLETSGDYQTIAD